MAAQLSISKDLMPDPKQQFAIEVTDPVFVSIIELMIALVKALYNVVQLLMLMFSDGIPNADSKQDDSCVTYSQLSSLINPFIEDKQVLLSRNSLTLLLA